MINDKNNSLSGVGSTPKYLSHQLGGYTSNQSASNTILPPDPLAGQMGQIHLPNASSGNQNYSPVPQSTKRKPPLPSPFMAKLDSHSKLAYNQNVGSLPSKGEQSSYNYKHPAVAQSSLITKHSQNSNLVDDKALQYNKMNHHQISQGHIPTVSQIQAHDKEDEMRQTWGKMKPKISKQLPLPFSGISKVPKNKS